MAAAVRLRTVLFDRLNGAGPLQILPKGEAPSAVDWELTASGTRSRAVAYPRRVLEPGRIAITAEFDVLASTAGPVAVSATAGADAILGNVAPVELRSLVAGTRRALQFEVEVPAATARGVGSGVVGWRWTAAAGGEPPASCGSSSHPVFVLVGEPAPPWGRPGTPRTAALWLDVLKVACAWARPAATGDECLRKITEAVHALGRRCLPDGRCIGYSESPNFSGASVYYVSNFLGMARLSPRGPNLLNCTDCAGAVALMSAALGCEAGVIRLAPRVRGRTPKLRTNVVQLIGETQAGRTTFLAHALTATAGTERRVWDACAKVDMDADPAEATQSSLALPAGLPLVGGSSGELGYTTRLLRKHHPVPDVIPVGHGGVLYPDRLPEGVTWVVDAYLRRRRRELLGLMRGARWSRPVAGQDPASVLRLQLARSASSTWTTTLQNGPFSEDMLTTWHRDAAVAPAALRYSIVAPPTRLRALRVFLDLVAGLKAPAHPVCGIGDFAFHCPRGEIVFILRDRVVIQIGSDPEGRTPVLPAARHLDAELSLLYS